MRSKRARQQLAMEIIACSALATPGHHHLHALLEAVGRINYHVIALQETKSRKTDVRQMSDGTLNVVKKFHHGSASNLEQELGTNFETYQGSAREDESTGAGSGCFTSRASDLGRARSYNEKWTLKTQECPYEAKRPRGRPTTRCADMFVARVDHLISAGNEQWIWTSRTTSPQLNTIIVDDASERHKRMETMLGPTQRVKTGHLSV
ncbi:unnamed protein product [Strongylus vulgaris]|uniref:Endonuclease/exonuclease/phosphatase domain-containing protein n=1 Tax=Strongylus vulgaris TaxID=40348 RepID=A0A3P7LCQ6_STRVU|nr:unnamed protein product [Strongylus vulgaris]